jgi:hypothetical protein
MTLHVFRASSFLQEVFLQRASCIVFSARVFALVGVFLQAAGAAMPASPMVAALAEAAAAARIPIAWLYLSTLGVRKGLRRGSHSKR